VKTFPTRSSDEQVPLEALTSSSTSNGSPLMKSILLEAWLMREEWTWQTM